MLIKYCVKMMLIAVSSCFLFGCMKNLPIPQNISYIDRDFKVPAKVGVYIENSAKEYVLKLDNDPDAIITGDPTISIGKSLEANAIISLRKIFPNAILVTDKINIPEDINRLIILSIDGNYSSAAHKPVQIGNVPTWLVAYLGFEVAFKVNCEVYKQDHTLLLQTYGTVTFKYTPGKGDKLQAKMGTVNNTNVVEPIHNEVTTTTITTSTGSTYQSYITAQPIPITTTTSNYYPSANTSVLAAAVNQSRTIKGELGGEALRLALENLNDQLIANMDLIQ